MSVSVHTVWDDIRMMLQASVTPMPGTDKLQHFHVRLDHRPCFVDREVLVPGVLLHSWTDTRPDSIQTPQR